MLTNCSLWNVASVFFDQPEKQFELLTISKQVKLAHTSVKLHLQTLIAQNLVRKEPVPVGNKKNVCYRANRQHSQFRNYKRLYNLDVIQNSGIIAYLEKSCEPNCIVLFGSFQKAEDLSSSDIDIFVESQEKQLNLDLFEKRMNRKVQLHFKSSFTNYPAELKNNIVNGIVLFGYLEGYHA